MEKQVLVHACCAPCSTYSFEKLKKDGYNPIGFFYNPNIHPEKEYLLRRDELINYAENIGFRLIIKDEAPTVWFEAVKGLEDKKEGGARCSVCFKLRLEETAKYAKDNGYEYFTTVLTISPHKNSKIINEIGNDISLKYGIKFLEEDFKKKDGFKKSIELSKNYGLYRQTHCGCIFSKK
jgi:predicted adenine nucleotide alpha hydrolase (AANH) superfamily ATPase